MTRLSLALTLLLILATAPAALADGMIVPTDPRLAVRGGWAVKYHHVRITVRDQVASVTIDQEFVNTGSGMIEVEYLFPVPPEAAIDAMTLVVDGEEMTGRLLPADEARKIYEDIVRRKKDPALLEYAGYGLYRTRAFPLEPGKPCKVVVHYEDVCRKDGETVRVWYPLNTEKFSARAIENVKVIFDVKSAADVTNLYSPTHEISVERRGSRHVVATYEESDVLPQRDILLHYRAANESVGATFLTHQPDAKRDGYFLLLVSPNPRSDGRHVAVPKDLVVVFDHSGSMAGEKIAQAREALRGVVGDLRPEDRFNLVAYNDAVESLHANLERADGARVEEALDWIDRVEAGGGTNIHDALSEAIGMFTDSDRPGFLLFLTDGIPTVGVRDVDTIVTDITSRNGGRVRLFPFGVGYDVNTRLLDKLAARNGGRSDYVREGEPVGPRVAALSARIRNPVMTDIEVEIPGLRLRQVYPRRRQDLFDGDQILMVGRYSSRDVEELPMRDGRPAGQLVVRGKYLGEQRGFEYPVRFRRPGGSLYAFVERLWAVRRIGALLDEVQLHGEDDELIDELVHLSTKYGVITPYTSFLAEEADRPADDLARREATRHRLHALGESLGAVAQADAANRKMLRHAPRAPAAGGAVVVQGFSGPDAYEAGRRRQVATVRQIGNRALYRRGKVWVTPETEQVDPGVPDADVVEIGQFSDEYFRLVAANTPEENRILATQASGEELLIELRGQVYWIR